MDYPEAERNRELARNFLQDLLFLAKDVEEMNLLAEILLGMQCDPIEPKETEIVPGIPEPQSRFEILKLRPEGAVSVGAVQGADHARKILVCLNATEDGIYLLYDRSTRSVVESFSSIGEADESRYLN